MTDSRPGDIFQPNDLLNNTYRIQSLLGRGGTSEVYKARSEISGRVVALKALKSEFSTNDDYLVLMTREEDVRDIRHDAIVRYYDNQRMPNGVVYLVMDFVDGPGLEAKLKSGGMSAEDLMVIGARVSEGLVAAHERNIVHRDLSPDNIILRNGEPSEAVIIDFGIAKDTNPGAETIVGNEFAGKYAYAAPEQLSGQTDARSDIYSLGALLLSTYRGEKPDMGANPMEVVQKKSQAPNVDGVPEPLRSLIAKMCDPLPANRFQTAVEMLAAFRDPSKVDMPAAVSADDLDDATVITKPPSRPSDPPKSEAPKAAAKKPEPKKKSKALVPIIAGLVIVGGGAGAFFSGALDSLFTPALPVADPYVLTIEKPEGGPLTASGNVPSVEVQTALSEAMAAGGGSADLTVATGEISETWGHDIMLLASEVGALDEYSIRIRGDDVRIEGMTDNRTLQDTMSQTFNIGGMPGNLDGEINIALGPRILQTSALTPLLDQHADCGPLKLVAAPDLGYPMGARVLVEGKLAETSSRVTLYDSIVAIAGDRPVTIDAEVLSPALCQTEAALPSAPSGGFDVKFSFGETGEANPSGRYFVDENPVIDVIIPDGINDGFMYVSVIDVSGNVFHLMPNLNRPTKNVAELRGGETGPFPVRVAYSLTEAAGTNKLAFLIDANTLGKSKILVLYSEQELFDGTRPTTESAASYADALSAARDNGELRVKALDTGILTSVSR